MLHSQAQVSPISYLQSLVDLPRLRQHFLGIALPRGSNRIRKTDDALLVDNDGSAIGNPLVFEKHAILFSHVPLGMEILQEWERNPTTRFRPIVMRESAIDAHTQNLGVTGLELFFESFQARYFLGSGRCPIERIEN